jgi:UDP-3-O-[3-hydroxymyristoyl] glucosamine N-acyltransferase
MLWTIKDLAARVDGLVVGRADFEVSELCALDDAKNTAISPYFRKPLLARATTVPGAVLTRSGLADFALTGGVRAAIVHRQPAVALAGLIDIFHPKNETPGHIHPSAFVDPEARIHPTATIGPMAVVEAGASVGEQSLIGPGAVICERCHVGRYVRIGPGAVVGAEGFGVVPGENGLVKLRHVGEVIIEDYVEIGANTCIDRGTLGATTIGQDSKLDNLVQVGHNTHIGKRVLVAGQVGLAGSTVVEDDVMLGGQVGVADHVTIGARAKVAGKSGVTRNVAENEIVAGFPALPRAKWLRAMAWLARMGSHSKKMGGEKS